MLHVQGDSFVDGGKGFSILCRYTKTCRDNADKFSLLNHRCLHIYVFIHPRMDDGCPGTLFRKPNGSFRPLLICTSTVKKNHLTSVNLR